MQFFNAYSHWRNTSMTQNSRFNISSFTLHVLAMGLMLRNHGRLLWNWSFNCFDILFFPKTNLENLINPIYTPVTHFTRFISLFWFYCDIDCWNNSPECSHEMLLRKYQQGALNGVTILIWKIINLGDHFSIQSKTKSISRFDKQSIDWWHFI